MAKHITTRDAWNGIADCRTCGLRDSVLFGGLEEQDFEKIHKPIDQFTLAPGTVLYRAGEPGTRLITVRQGLIKLVQYLPDGQQRIVRLVKTAGLTGLEALLGHPYEHDAIVLQPTEVCSLPVDVVKKLSIENAKVQEELLRRWHEALSNADSWLRDLNTGTAKQRVARLLMRLCECGRDGNCTLLGREDMGAILGITTETASRTVAEFKRAGWIKESAGNRVAVDHQALNQLLE